MLPSHVSILKANKGELEALAHLDSRTAAKTIPLFEIGRLTEAIRQRKYIQQSRTPTITHLNRVLDAVGNVWSSRHAMVDGYHWSADASTENGEHVIAYMIARLRAKNVSVIPVLGYDRWGNAAYRFGLKAIPARDDGHFCLRLDSSAVEDAAEPELFQETIRDIVDALELDPSRCSVLLDFADISSGTTSIEALIQKSDNIIRHLEEDFGFSHYIIAGCSIPRSINLAIGTRDSAGMVLRKEMLAWQALRLSIPDVPLVSGDYGVRGPTTIEAPSKYTNGKIRYTTKKQTFVVRGHAFIEDHSNVQMSRLAKAVVKSPHFLGENFSWGDGQIKICSDRGAFGSPGTWIAIDTNHHLVFAVQEVEEFERDRIAKVRVES
jgi:hypothetical protein